ncbi:Rpn family recombination-promoting nuclease/putative transposase [Paenibacillus sp. GCM10027626]|uniref:Rpn family recombination-promoting nuclease/putative transposase n=1 Tax=Paenibacillus sp. GCM10027626 TaxID=3273411 RepID=UPI003644101C
MGKRRSEFVRHPHDRGYKHLLSSKQIFLELLRSFVKRGWVDQIDEANIIKVDKSYILQDFSGKEADLVYRVKIRDREVIFYILIELQSTVDTLMPWRLLSYQVEIWRQIMRDTPRAEKERKGFRLPVIVPLVLYNGSDSWSVPLEFRGILADDGLFEGEHLLNFSYFLLDVCRYTTEDLEKLSNLIGTVFLIEQNTHLKVDELVDLFKKLAPTIDKTPVEQRQAFATWFEHILRRLMKNKGEEAEVQHMVEQIYKKGMSVVISNLERNLEWIREQAILQGLEQGLEKGLEKGLEQGLEKGLEQGVEQGLGKAAINMLRKGMDIDLVVEVTGLVKEKVEQLSKQIK